MPVIILSAVILLSMAVFVYLGAYTLLRCEHKNKYYFSALLFPAFLYLFGYFLEINALSVEGAFTAIKVMYLGSALAAEYKFLSVNESARILFPGIREIDKFDPIDKLDVWPSELSHVGDKETVTFEMPGDFHYSARISPIAASKDSVLGYVILIQDITESVLLTRQLVAAKETAEEATQAKSKFLATMSHEIRTPMNAIIGISDIELDSGSHPDETLDAFDRINNSGKTLLGIINDILDLSKIETGKMELLPVKYDTPSLINDTARLNIMRIGGKPIDFIVKVSETLPAALFGDELRIKQILNNMLSNAIKYTEQGSVTFGVDSQTDENGVMLVFTIADTGQGMTKEQLAKLYDEYSMFNQEANRKTEGTGLGMSITKELVEMMSGRIEAESEPGVGSAFKVYLLQQPADGGVLGKEAAEDLQNFKFTSSLVRGKVVREYMPYGSVLVVDDVDANIFVAKGLMRPYGLKIETAVSGYEALDKVRAGAVYDIIFMDHMMPGMDGVETTKILRDEGYTRPIVALTANALAGMKEVFIESGFDDFVSKPIDTRQLNHVLNILIHDKQPPEVLEDAKRKKDAIEAEASQAEGCRWAEECPRAGECPRLTGGKSVDIKSMTLLKAIDGLDVDSALAAMSGMTDVYLDTVKLTARLLPERIEKMDRFIDADMKSFAIEVHGLKSALKNIGASALGNSAAKLERAAVENDIACCTENYPSFRTGLNELKDSLNEAIAAEPAEDKETLDISSLAQVLTEAKAAVENYDEELALEALTPCADYTYGSETDELLQCIIHALEAFDFEKAMEMINKMEEKLNGTL